MWACERVEVVVRRQFHVQVIAQDHYNSERCCAGRYRVDESDGIRLQRRVNEGQPGI